MASQIWDTGEEVQPNVCQCLAIQYENPFLSGGIPLQYRCIGDMLDLVFFSRSPKGDISLLSIFRWLKLRQEQSDWMLLNGAMSLEPGDKAEVTVRNNLGQHVMAAGCPTSWPDCSRGPRSGLVPALFQVYSSASFCFCEHQISFQ